jgi:hypothetical protein
MAPWIYDKKFSAGEDDDPEHPAQEQEEWRMMTIGFEFHRGLKNSMITFQATIRQPAMTNPIGSLARLPIGTPSTTNRFSELALGEI